MGKIAKLRECGYLPTAILLIMAVGYIAFFTVMSIRQHDGLQTHVFDLGNVDQTVWNTIHGRPLHFTTQPEVGENRLGMHVEPILFLVALSYLIYPDPRGLLIIQTIALGLGAVPLYALARRHLGSRWAALAFPFAYLSLPALQAANLFEFHAVALAPLFLLTAFYFLDRACPLRSSASPLPADDAGSRTNWGLYALFVFLALCCKEDISLLIMVLGVYILIFRRRWLPGVLTLVAGAVWFYLAVYVVIPHFRPGGSPFLNFYEGLGDNPLKMTWKLLNEPSAAQTTLLTAPNTRALLALLLPLAGLPLFGFPFWFLAGPSLGINLLSANPLMHRMERYHYAVPIIPVILISAVYGMRWLSGIIARGSERRRVLYIGVLAVLVLGMSLWYQTERGFTPLAHRFSWPEVTAHDRLIDEVAKVIPPEATLAAQANLFPHVSQRERAYFWPDPRDKEYVLLDVSDPTFWNRDGAQQRLKGSLKRDPTFGWTLARDGYLVLKKGEPLRPLPEEFYSFAKADQPAIQYPMAVDFGDAVRFMGFTPLYDREEEVRFYLYFQALRPLERDYTVTLYLADEAGTVVGGTDRPQPVLVWYPTSRWQPGETVRVLANTINWWTGDRREYAVALSILNGSDIWDVGLRLTPRLKESKWATRLLADASLLQLMRFRRSWELPYAVEELRRFDAPQVAMKMNAHFEGRADLVGYRLAQAKLKQGEAVDLTLFWKSLAAWDTSYTVFVHLRDANGKVVAQQDVAPGAGQLPTTVWMPGEYVTDHHRISLMGDAPLGRYRLAVGLYRPDTGARLPVTGEPGVAQEDHVVLDQEIEIVN